MSNKQTEAIKLGLPKGRMNQGVSELLADAGIRITASERTYRPSISLKGFETKILKPQNIVEMLHLGSRDLGFAGADWVAELNAELVELLDTKLDPVRIVAAAPRDLLENGALPSRPLVVASEYDRLTTEWIKNRGLNATFVHCYGATEVFPPEDADCIVDNTATGSTLRANNLDIVDELMTSSTRLYANPQIMDNPEQRSKIEDFVMVVKSVLEARNRVMIEVNVSKEDFDQLVAILPCMREPTVSELHSQSGFAIKIAVPKKDLPTLIPQIKAHGGTDIIVTKLSQIVP